MKDRIDDLMVFPHTTVAHVAGMCDALSDENGQVCLKIYSHNGQMRFKFEREAIDETVPVFLRRQSAG